MADMRSKLVNLLVKSYALAYDKDDSEVRDRCQLIGSIDGLLAYHDSGRYSRDAVHRAFRNDIARWLVTPNALNYIKMFVLKAGTRGVPTLSKPKKTEKKSSKKKETQGVDSARILKDLSCDNVQSPISERLHIFHTIVDVDKKRRLVLADDEFELAHAWLLIDLFTVYLPNLMEKMVAYEKTSEALPSNIQALDSVRRNIVGSDSGLACAMANEFLLKHFRPFGTAGSHDTSKQDQDDAEPSANEDAPDSETTLTNEALIAWIGTMADTMETIDANIDEAELPDLGLPILREHLNVNPSGDLEPFFALVYGLPAHLVLQFVSCATLILFMKLPVRSFAEHTKLFNDTYNSPKFLIPRTVRIVFGIYNIDHLITMGNALSLDNFPFLIKYAADRLA